MECNLDEYSEETAKEPNPIDESGEILTMQPIQNDEEEMVPTISENENGFADDNLVHSEKASEEEHEIIESVDEMDAQNEIENMKSTKLQEVSCNGNLQLSDTNNIDLPTTSNGVAATEQNPSPGIFILLHVKKLIKKYFFSSKLLHNAR